MTYIMTIKKKKYLESEGTWCLLHSNICMFYFLFLNIFSFFTKCSSLCIFFVLIDMRILYLQHYPSEYLTVAVPAEHETAKNW